APQSTQRFRPWFVESAISPVLSPSAALSPADAGIDQPYSNPYSCLVEIRRQLGVPFSIQRSDQVKLEEHHVRGVESRRRHATTNVAQTYLHTAQSSLDPHCGRKRGENGACAVSPLRERPARGRSGLRTGERKRILFSSCHPRSQRT